MGRDPDRPTVPEASEELRAYYRLPKRGLGGAAHCILEDGNVGQATADSCAANAESWAREWGGVEHMADDVRITQMLAAMSNTQRARLYRLHFYPPEPERPSSIILAR